MRMRNSYRASRVAEVLPHGKDMNDREMKRVWFGLLLVYFVLTTWSFQNSIHSCSFVGLFGSRVECLLISADAPLFLNAFSVQGNVFTLLLLVLLAYLNVSGNENDLQQDTM